jgi:hypothetical protein
LTPTLKRSITLYVAGSMTYTSLELTLGTYTRGSAPLTAFDSLPAVALAVEVRGIDDGRHARDDRHARPRRRRGCGRLLCAGEGGGERRGRARDAACGNE